MAEKGGALTVRVNHLKAGDETGLRPRPHVLHTGYSNVLPTPELMLVYTSLLIWKSLAAFFQQRFNVINMEPLPSLIQSLGTRPGPERCLGGSNVTFSRPSEKI